jgi:hypothetical protein
MLHHVYVITGKLRVGPLGEPVAGRPNWALHHRVIAGRGRLPSAGADGYRVKMTSSAGAWPPGRSY